ncbi:hypothetical protein [Agriterribacter sp.]|uniref:hypothetical protein n=1 Tax=Agriterribacter sp. TaxID=2821509 RepID=UPI002C6285B4|nr:hypothetical protein [Agriterribacter sp.]HRO46700.1 hypothetical protein [Agriterribacter sp.]HRQ16960.1 hypothetical protein [Agriterribacter sp.]
MRTFIVDIIPKIQRFSKKLDDLTKLTNQHWVSLGDINQTKKVFIFRQNNQLLISENGIVEKGSWEYLGNQSLLIDTKQESYLLKHGFFDENVIALKLDSTDSYAFFVNESKYDNELNNINDVIRFLNDKYLKENSTRGLGATQNRTINPPEYKTLDISEDTSFFGGMTKIYTIEFLDGKRGEVYLKPKNNQAYYKDKRPNSWVTELHYYKSLDYCINALYYFLETGDRLDDGYIITYS